MKNFSLFIFAFALAFVTDAIAEVITPHVPCGYQQISTLSSAQALTVPTTCGGQVTLATITPEAQAVRYRDDGTAPTSSVGQPMAVGAVLNYTGTLSKIKFIEQTSGAKLNVSYYR